MLHEIETMTVQPVIDNHLELSAEGQPVGRDPRKMSSDEFSSIGFEKKSLYRVIREKCLACCCHQPTEVRLCVCDDCPLWPYRMGTNPFKRKLGVEERQRRAEQLRQNAGSR